LPLLGGGATESSLSEVSPPTTSSAATRALDSFLAFYIYIRIYINNNSDIIIIKIHLQFWPGASSGYADPDC